MDANAAESSASRGNDRSHRKRQAAKVLWRDNEVAQKEKTRLQKRARVSDAEVKKLTGNCVGGSLCATVTDAIKAFWFCADACCRFCSCARRLAPCTKCAMLVTHCAYDRIEQKLMETTYRTDR